MKIPEAFCTASSEEIRAGYKETNEEFICLLCGKRIEKGIIYQDSDILYRADKYIQIHIHEEHDSVFEYLLNLDKKLTGLTEHQKSIIKLFQLGKSDAEIQKEMNIGSSSTIRNHRFSLREKERQSKVTLALMELLREKNESAFTLAENRSSKVADKRKKAESKARDEYLKKYFPEDKSGLYNLQAFMEIARQLQNDQLYSEKEINQILKSATDDHITLRRYLIEYGILDRKPDGSQYWLNISLDEEGEEDMDRKRELKQLFKETPTERGVYQVRNKENGKIFVTATNNTKNIVARIGMLDAGSHINKALQKEWKEYGKEAFEVEILELLDKKDEEIFDLKDELKKLENKWINKLESYGDRGYNKKPESKE